MDWNPAAQYRESLGEWADANAGSADVPTRNAVEKVREVLCIEDDQRFLVEARVAFSIFLTDTNPFAKERTPLDELHSIVCSISETLMW